MNVRRNVTLSALASAALLVSSVTLAPPYDNSARAQQADGKGASGANRPSPTGKASQPSRPEPSTINRGTARPSTAAPQRASQPRTIRRNVVGAPNRVVIRDGDRRRGAGDRRRGTRYVWGPGLAFYFYDGFYHGDCAWLRRKARETGSSYWRRRYERCRHE